MPREPHLTRRETLQLAACAAASTALGLARADAIPTPKTIAGTKADALIARHLKLTGTQREIGQKLAQIAKQRGSTLSPMDPAIGAKRAAWFQKMFPELAERGKGVAQANHVKGNEKDVFSLNYNVFAPGCSCSYYPPDRTTSGHALLSRNYDFSTGSYQDLIGQPTPKGARGFTADPYLLECHPTGGYATLMMVSYDLLAGCIDGMNEHGLAVALLADDQAGGQGRATIAQAGLGEIEVPRFLLERCRSVDEAIVLAKKIPYYFSFIPCHYIVGDPTGHSVVLEWEAVSKKLHIVEGSRKPQVVTNHLLSAYPDPMRQPDDGPGGSFRRYQSLTKNIQPRDKMSRAEIIAFHQSVMPKGSGAQLAQPVGRTLWHSIYDLKARTLDISFYLHDSPEGALKQKRTDYLRFSLS